MTSAVRHMTVACTFLLACGGAATDPASTPAPDASNETEATDATKESTSDFADLPVAPFCNGSPYYDAVTGLIFDALAPEPAADYMAMRRNGGSISEGLTEDLQTVRERGELCLSATDVTKCKNDYAALSPPVSSKDHVCFTRGDATGCLESAADAMDLLKEVSSLEEAFFVAAYAGDYSAICTYEETRAAGKKLADGTFRVVMHKGGDCAAVYRAVLDVRPDGKVTELEAVKTDLDLPCP